MTIEKEQNRNFEFIKMFQDLGLNVIPCKEKSKEPAISWKEYQNKKYFGHFEKDCNLAVICGKVSGGLVVIDIDSPELFPGFEKLKEETLVTRTGSGGYHIFGKVTGDLPPIMRLNNDKKQHIDIQSEGTYVIVPPSVHPDGAYYGIVSTAKTIANLDFEGILGKIKDLGFNTDQPRKPISEIISGVTEGNRNDSAFKFACYLLDTRKLDQGAAWYELDRWNKESNKPPLPDKELKAVFSSALKRVSPNIQPKTISKKQTIPKKSIYKMLPSDDGNGEEINLDNLMRIEDPTLLGKKV